jgi:hypothetical protein
MTLEIWQAKKIVDSTLHPGMSYGHSTTMTLLLTVWVRHRPTSVPPFPDVMLRYIESDSHRRHAQAWIGSKYLLGYTNYC